jgi:hypothetical protein
MIQQHVSANLFAEATRSANKFADTINFSNEIPTPSTPCFSYPFHHHIPRPSLYECGIEVCKNRFAPQ